MDQKGEPNKSNRSGGGTGSGGSGSGGGGGGRKPPRDPSQRRHPGTGTGDGGYPPILTEQEYAAMQSIKAKKNTQKNVNYSEGIFTLNTSVVCPNCGGRMHRRFDRRRKATTWWRCPECKASVNISDEDMLNGITELLNEVIGMILVNCNACRLMPSILKPKA